MTGKEQPAIVLGTRNHKKRLELEDLLAPLGIGLQTLDEYPQSIDVDETGSTFGENAALKATEQAQLIDRWVLAEDSGICVDALKGAPGIFSKRFSGAQGTDESNNQLLLEKLADVPPQKRNAHYVCHMALADPGGTIRLRSEAICRGRIRTEPAGTGGFGYDPLFEIRECHRTFGELGPAIKRVISHRARAMQRFVWLLQGLDEFSAAARAMSS